MRKCHICKGTFKKLFSVPFDQSGGPMPIVDTTPIWHYQCQGCGLLATLDIYDWSAEEITKRIYNDTYHQVDTGYGGVRAKSWADALTEATPNKANIKHLDYGGGEGHLSRMLHSRGWNSATYDPYAVGDTPTGKYNLITAIEVFEHSFNIVETITDIKKFLAKPGVILFSTQLVPPKVDGTWWYLCPRGGHVAILTTKALKLAAKQNGLGYKELDEGVHCLFRREPEVREVLGV